jgi:hypothetical protein
MINPMMKDFQPQADDWEDWQAFEGAYEEVMHGLSEQVRSLRPDLNTIASRSGLPFTLLIDISCLYGRISYGGNTSETVYIDKLEKYRRLTHETGTIRGMKIETIRVIVSSLGIVYAESLEALKSLLSCDDRKKKKIRRRQSDAAIVGSFQIW